MTRRLTFCLTLFALSLAHHAEAQVGFIEPATRVLLVGDSWARVILRFNVLNDVLDEGGFGDVKAAGENTAVGGSKVSDWITDERLQLLTDEIAAFPDVSFIHLSLGGNDFTNRWKASMSPEEEDRVFAEIADGLRVVVEHILAQRESIQVLVCGYTYLNFDETSATGRVAWCAHEGEESIWAKMGSPDPERLNRALAKFEDRRASAVADIPRARFVNNLGLMQHEFGYDSKGLEPGKVPLPHGDPTLASPPDAFYNKVDCMHLSLKGYSALCRRCFHEFYRDRLMPQGDFVDCPAVETKSSFEWADMLPELERPEPGDDLSLGDAGVLCALINFDTAAVPRDATITHAVVFLTRKIDKGRNPFQFIPFDPYSTDPHGYVQGPPLCSIAAYPTDPGQTIRPKMTVAAGRFAGSLPTNGSRLRIEATGFALKKHDFSGPTQYRLNFTKSDGNAVRDAVTFYGAAAEDPSNRPLLRVYYEKHGN